MSSIYVFAYGGYEGECYLVEADSETEALGKIVEENGFTPTAECAGTVEDIMFTSTNRVVKLV